MLKEKPNGTILFNSAWEQGFLKSFLRRVGLNLFLRLLLINIMNCDRATW